MTIVKEIWALPSIKYVLGVFFAVSLLLSGLALVLSGTFATDIAVRWAAADTPVEGFSAGSIFIVGNAPTVLTAPNVAPSTRFTSNNNLAAVYNTTTNQFTLTPQNAGEVTFFFGNRLGQVTAMDMWVRDDGNVAGYEFPQGLAISVANGSTTPLDAVFTATLGNGAVADLVWTSVSTPQAVVIVGNDFIAGQNNGREFFTTEFIDVWGRRHQLSLTVSVGSGFGAAVRNFGGGAFGVRVPNVAPARYIRTDANGTPASPLQFLDNYGYPAELPGTGTPPVGTLQIDTAPWVVGYGGNTTTRKVDANVSWTAVSSEAWLVATGTDDLLTMVAAVNTQTTTRSAVVILSPANGEPVLITVNQGAA